MGGPLRGWALARPKGSRATVDCGGDESGFATPGSGTHPHSLRRPSPLACASGALASAAASAPAAAVAGRPDGGGTKAATAAAPARRCSSATGRSSAATAAATSRRSTGCFARATTGSRSSQRFADKTHAAVRDVQRRRGLSRDRRGQRPHQQRSAPGMGTQKASWYGPGFFGNRTACGQTLTRKTIGVAHRNLPAGPRSSSPTGALRADPGDRPRSVRQAQPLRARLGPDPGARAEAALRGRRARSARRAIR